MVALFRGAIALFIFLFTLFLVIRQPRNLEIGYGALIGAALAIVAGIVTLEDIPPVWAVVWNPTLTLIALIILSLILDDAGFFQSLALQIAHWGKGNTAWLFSLLILLTAAVSAVLTNDGAVLILTPIAIALLQILEFRPSAQFAILMSVGFVADAASLPFTVSNLVNLIAADFFNLSFIRYALVMLPVNLIGVATSLGVLWFYFQRVLPKRYPLTRLPKPDSAIHDPVVFRLGFPILFLLLVGYFFAEPLGIPVCAIAGLGAFLLIGASERWFRPNKTPLQPLKPRPAIAILRQAPWQVVLFSLGMYLVVTGLQNVGLTELLSHLLVELAGWGMALSIFGMGFLATLLASISNNLPTGLINAIAIESSTNFSPSIQQAMTYANVIGCDVGAKITPIGSLSTLLWLAILARKGIGISWREYLRIAVILTLPVLLVCLTALAIWLPGLTV